jgi:hypothetical protein
VQEGEVDVHRAREEVHVRRLAGNGYEQLLALDPVAQVEQLALGADASDRVGPLQAALLAQDVDRLELLVDVELLLNLALLLGDAREALRVLLALCAGRCKACLLAFQGRVRNPQQRHAAGDQRERDEQRQR